MNAKRVRRLMRKDNLLCVRKRKFVVTTDSNHGRKIYPHPARNVILTGTDQLWVAWPEAKTLGDLTLEDELTLSALRMALARRVVQPGLVHHSGRGTLYASSDYTNLLKDHGITISMSRKGNPWDKAYASHCTSVAHCGTTGPATALFDSLTPWALHGAFSPGCS